MTPIKDSDLQNTPEMNAWREKIKKDLAAAGVRVGDNFKMEAVSKKNKVYGFPSIDHDPRKDADKQQDMRVNLNPDGAPVKREYYRGRSAKKKGAKPAPKPPVKKAPPPVRRPYAPPEIVVVLPEQETLIAKVAQSDDYGVAPKKPLPKTIQDVYQDAVISGKPTDGYLKMDLTAVRFPAEWRIPKENRSVIAIGAMREFREKLESNIKTMEASTSRKMFTKTIEAYKRKLEELLRYY